MLNLSRKNINLNYLIVIGFLLCSMCFSTDMYSQQNSNENLSIAESTIKIAPVKLDGHFLFNVRGVSSYPAEERAKQIGQRIKNIATNDSISVAKIKIVPTKDYSYIYIGENVILRVFDEDAEIEGIDRNLAAQVISKKIGSAIIKYRTDRSQKVIIKNVIQAFISIVVLIIILFIVIRLSNRISNALQNKIKTRIDAVDSISFNLIKSNQIWKAFHVLTNSIRNILIHFNYRLFY